VTVVAVCMMVAGGIGFRVFRHHGRLSVLAVVLEGLGIAGQFLFLFLRVRQRRRLKRR